MDSFQIQSQRNVLIEANKKSLKNYSVILFIFGVFFLLVFIRIFTTHIIYIYLPLASLYILTGVLGFISTNNESKLYMKIFKVLVYAIIAVNTVFIVLAVILCIILLANPVDCSEKRDDDMCGLGQALSLLLVIACGIVILVCSLIVLLLYTILKHIRRYNEDMEQYNFIHYT